MNKIIQDKDYLKFINNATKTVPLLKFLYIINIPLAKLLIRLKLTPFTISTISNIFAFLALLALFFEENPIIFSILWILSLFFDIADGIVARKTFTTSANGSFYDHFSDQIKVFLLFICLGIKYNNYYFWIFVFSANGFFLLLGYLNQLLTLRRYQIKQVFKSKTNQEIHVKNKKSFIRNFFNNRSKLKKVILGLYASVFSMYGNCMLFLLPVSYGIEYAVFCLVLFKLITLRSIVQIILEIITINSEFYKNKISWK